VPQDVHYRPWTLSAASSQRQCSDNGRIPSNRGFAEWGEVFGDPVVAAAILDRLMHNAVVFNIKGPSWRLREHHGLTTATTST